MSRGRAVCGIILAATATMLAAGCHREGCVGGDDGTCVPPSACAAIHYPSSCTSGASAKLQVAHLAQDPQRAAGPKALAAGGDFLLENDLVRVVLDEPDHPQNLAPSGGSLLDLTPVGTLSGGRVVAAMSGDQINGVYQTAGLLPRDAVHYESWHVIDEHLAPNVSDAYVAVVFRGHLEGDRRVTVVTRYELRACEPGVRVRSNLYNGAPDPNTLYLTDGFFWGDQTLAPFAPGQGLGFRAPDVELLHIDRAWREWPFVAARSQASPDVSYAVVPCDQPKATGFNSPTLTAAGLPLSPTLPGDGIHYERFILATPGPGLAPAIAEALHVRTMVHGDPPAVTVTGRVVAGGVPIDGVSGKAASLLFYEPAFGANPDDESRRTPWSEAVPGPDGKFAVTLPPDRSYRVQPYAFGRPAAPPTSFAVARANQDIGDLTLTASAHLVATVLPAPDLTTPPPKTFAELVIVPFDPPNGMAAPSFYGLFPGCDPMLGPPHGSSPACNRAVLDEDYGPFDLLLPPGRYYVYATRGPFATLDRQEITVGPGDEAHLRMVSQDLPGLLPAGVVSGDFHVHGAASYDSSIPDQDRVVSFLAAGVDVIVATDHDVVTNYASTLTTLGVNGTTPGVNGRMVVIPGVEETPNILWFDVPGEDFPKTLGHFNFWPLTPDFTAARNGAPWDELREPGQMMDDMDRDPIFTSQGVRQVNHPYAETKLGRDQGFLRAIGYDPRTAINGPVRSFAADVLLRAPGGGRRNLDWDVQEVMTGASRADWLRYRALWFSLLTQGITRAGAANSDTHSLSLERVGYPRNLVFGNGLPGTGHGNHRDDLEAGHLDVARFNADVRAGHMVGTNGPILDVTIEDTGKDTRRPGLDPIAVTLDASLSISVTAAPWIPVTEIRVFVNGALVSTLPTWKPESIDHFGTQVGSIKHTIRLSTLLPGKGDAWLVVEAGLHQDTPPDTDDDGLPDLPDDDIVPTRPASGNELFDLAAIAPGVWPTAFSNPFLLDLDGDGRWQPGPPP